MSDVVEEVITQSGYSDNILLMGDFKLPDVDWNSCDSPDEGESAQSIVNLATVHNLKQLNSTPNLRGVILDLVFSSIHSSEVVGAHDVLVAEDRHHPALNILLNISNASISAGARYLLDYRKCNLNEVFRSLQQLNYPVLDSSSGAELSFDNFCDILYSVIAVNTPTKRVVSDTFPKWFTKDLKQLVISKKIAHKLYKSTNNPSHFYSFRTLRKQCKYLTSQCFNRYISKIEDNISTNIKSFWSHVDGLKRSPKIPTRLVLDSRVAESTPERCELFSDYFSSVFSNDSVPIPNFDFGCNFTISNCVISPIDVQRKLENLDPNKSAGPDGIPPLVIKYCAPVLAPHLTVLFSALLACGTFPARLKRGYVVPIFKSGDRSNVKNYRPIVILSAIAKVYESIVLDYLYFNLRKCISTEQHGFLRSRSTITNLLEFREFIMSAFMDGCQVDCIYLDFAKAFDKVNIKLLIAKLKAYGVTGPLLEWIVSYMNRRILFVKCDGFISQPFIVTSGVPQGSHLGPLLFILFINDIGRVITSNFRMFADDIKIYARVLTALDHQQLQVTLSNIKRWCEVNSMSLNVSKCVAQSFKRGSHITIYDYILDGSILRRVVRFKDLGVIMTPSLSPFEHIMHITARASSLLGFIFRTTKVFQSPVTLVTLYKILVRPILEYGSVVWSPHQLNHCDQLQSIQRRFIRMLGCRLGYGYRAVPISNLETKFGIPSLQLRRQLHDLVCLFKLVNGVLDCPGLLSSVDFSIPRGTRSRTIFHRHYLPTNYAYHSGLSRLLLTGSEAATHLDFFNESINSFKRKAADLIM